MNKLNIAAIQADLKWENPAENLDYFAKAFYNLYDTDLVVLPEMFNTGFSMKTEKLAETMDGPTIKWMKNQARLHNLAILGSLIIEENGKYFNRFIMQYPCGDIKFYNKRHLFRMGNEHLHYSPGESRIIFKYQEWRIMPQVCYDLRFPVFARNQNDYDLLIYVANWPAPRKEVWKTLLKARALENQCYVIGVNRTGTDGENLSYTGNSVLLNYKAEELAQLPENEAGVLKASFKLDELNQFKEKFPVYKDADDFRLIY